MRKSKSILMFMAMAAFTLGSINCGDDADSKTASENSDTESPPQGPQGDPSIIPDDDDEPFSLGPSIYSVEQIMNFAANLTKENAAEILRGVSGLGAADFADLASATRDGKNFAQLLTDKNKPLVKGAYDALNVFIDRLSSDENVATHFLKGDGSTIKAIVNLLTPVLNDEPAIGRVQLLTKLLRKGSAILKTVIKTLDYELLVQLIDAAGETPDLQKVASKIFANVLKEQVASKLTGIPFVEGQINNINSLIDSVESKMSIAQIAKLGTLLKGGDYWGFIGELKNIAGVKPEKMAENLSEAISADAKKAYDNVFVLNKAQHQTARVLNGTNINFDTKVNSGNYKGSAAWALAKEMYDNIGKDSTFRWDFESTKRADGAEKRATGQTFFVQTINLLKSKFLGDNAAWKNYVEEKGSDGFSAIDYLTGKGKSKYALYKTEAEARTALGL